MKFWVILFFLIFLTGCSDVDNVQVDSSAVKKKAIVPVVEEVKKDIVQTETKGDYKIEEILNEIVEITKPEEPKVKKVEPVKQISDSNCHPSYSGCLRKNASDYDCAGGSGNGPYYTGKVRVLGPDVFGLDRDKDGWGCE